MKRYMVTNTGDLEESVDGFVVLYDEVHAETEMWRVRAERALSALEAIRDGIPGPRLHAVEALQADNAACLSFLSRV
jgi:hypothetical protein